MHVYLTRNVLIPQSGIFKELSPEFYALSRDGERTRKGMEGFNARQPILVIFGRDIAERVCYQIVIR